MIENTVGAPLIFLGPPVTQQRRYEWQRSLAMQSEYMVDSVISMLIKLGLQCIGNVCCFLLYSTQLRVHTKQWIQRLHGNGATNGNAHSLHSRSL